MPNAFQLIRKSTGQAEKFAVIDDELRQYLGVPPNEKSYYRGWYDSIGYAIAIGKSWDEIRATIVGTPDDPGDEESIKLVDWLIANFDTRAWYEPKM